MIPECEVKKLMNRQSGKPKRKLGVSTAWSVPPIPQKYATSNQRWFPVHIATITTTMPQSHSCKGNICCQVTMPWLRTKIKYFFYNTTATAERTAIMQRSTRDDFV